MESVFGVLETGEQSANRRWSADRRDRLGQRPSDPQRLVVLVHEMDERRHGRLAERHQCLAHLVPDPPVLQQRDQGRHVERVEAVAADAAADGGDRLAHHPSIGVVEQPDQVLLEARLVNRTDRLGGLGADLRIRVAQQLAQHLLGLCQVNLVLEVRQAGDRRRSHTRLTLLELG